MDNTRFILVLVLGVLGLMLYDAWQTDYGSAPEPVSEPSAGPSGGNAAAGDVPIAVAGDLPDVGVPGAPEAPGGAVAEAPSAGTGTVLESDTLRLDIAPTGATIVRAELKAYPVDADTPNRPFVLLTNNADRVFIAESGLIGNDVSVGHQVPFRARAPRYVLGPDDDAVTAYFDARVGDLEVTKTVTLQRGSYQVEIGYDIENLGASPFVARPYQQLKRTRESGREGFIYTFTGAALSTPDNHYKKYSFGDLEDTDINVTTEEGWVAFIQHYFLAAIVPDDAAPRRYYSEAISDDLFAVGTVGVPSTVPSGGRAELTERLFVGPKLQDRLGEIAPHLDLAVDYGWVWFIAKPLFWFLDKIHSVTGNWGVAIVLVTVCLKAALFPLSAAGYRSMANMRKLHPRLTALKERYGDDRQKLNQAMMDLYKKEKVNPLGGCFPILIQIPVFLSLYWVLLESVELRQASFALWIDDLSSKDPFFVLPLIMGLSMWFQQRLNPTPLDPMQQRVMQIMPIAMTGFFAFFPAGLVLYWVVNNVLSIAQQWYITRQIEGGAGT